MNVILSIKPKYVKNILDGSKLFEFRKQPLRPEVKKVYIYSSAPEKKIVASFELKQIIEDTPENLWSKLQLFAGISIEEFFTYYSGKEKGFAFGIENLEIFEEPIDPYTYFNKFTAPQSFLYLKQETKMNVFSPSKAAKTKKKYTKAPRKSFRNIIQ